MATITPTVLVANQPTTDPASVLYTVPNNTTVKITRAVFANNSASNSLTVSAGIANAGTTFGTDPLLFTYTLAPLETYVSSELGGAILGAGAQIFAISTPSPGVNVYISGLTIQ